MDTTSRRLGSRGLVAKTQVVHCAHETRTRCVAGKWFASAACIQLVEVMMAVAAPGRAERQDGSLRGRRVVKAYLFTVKSV